MISFPRDSSKPARPPFGTLSKRWFHSFTFCFSELLSRVSCSICSSSLSTFSAASSTTCLCGRHPGLAQKRIDVSSRNEDPRKAHSESAVLDPERRANTRDTRYSCAAVSSESQGARSGGAYRRLPRLHGQDRPIEDRHSGFQMPSLRHYVPWNRFQGQANYLPPEAGHSSMPILLNQIVRKHAVAGLPKDPSIRARQIQYGDGLPAPILALAEAVSISRRAGPHEEILSPRALRFALHCSMGPRSPVARSGRPSRQLSHPLVRSRSSMMFCVPVCRQPISVQSIA